MWGKGQETRKGGRGVGLEGLGVTCQGACTSSCDREEASGDFTRRSGTRRFASCKEGAGRHTRAGGGRRVGWTGPEGGPAPEGPLEKSRGRTDARASAAASKQVGSRGFYSLVIHQPWVGRKTSSGFWLGRLSGSVTGIQIGNARGRTGFWCKDGTFR